MKTCPKCGELLGDSVNVCIKCRYDYRYMRVVTHDELIEHRNKQIEESTAKEEQKKNQISKNPLFEYQIVVINDLSDGQIDDYNIQKTLNEWSENGWRLHSIFTNELGKTSSSISIVGFGAGINATIGQTDLIFERCIKS